MHIFNFILWNVSPEIFSLGPFHLFGREFGPLEVRWYGLLFAMGFLIGQQILIKIYKQEGKSEKNIETLTVYMVLSTIIGARLGHCLFYQPEIYLPNPIEILKIWEGGLASHGATIGILIAIYLYSRKVTDQSYFYVLDRIVIVIALAGCLIRLGNLMNSEIIGKPTELPTAFLFVNETKSLIEDRNPSIVDKVEIKENGEVMPGALGDVKPVGIDITVRFKKYKMEQDKAPAFIKHDIIDSLSLYKSIGENVLFLGNIAPVVKESKGVTVATFKALAIPRHPAQLYEAISSFLLFLLLYFIYDRKREKTPEGRIFGLFVVILFSLRFIYEFQKENQVDFETNLISQFGLNIGQLLSIPLIIAGLFILVRSYLKKNEIE